MKTTTLQITYISSSCSFFISDFISFILSFETGFIFQKVEVSNSKFVYPETVFISIVIEFIRVFFSKS
ncbi:MAG: hypothetical protein P1U46_03735 [Patescibacteria group bacterium]|nr:hypothetical protein [Patescibacteria group bacterium]